MGGTTNRPGAADLVFYNGNIAVMDPRGRFCSAVAVKKDRIDALGADKEVLSLRGGSTKMLNLAGRTVIPGLVDSHTHFPGAALSELEGELFIPGSVAELLDSIKARAGVAGEGAWLHFRNTYPARLLEGRFPTLRELDSAAPDNPVYVDAVYSGKANSRALRAAGINANTAPARGNLGKDPRTGRLDGTLFLCGYLIKDKLKMPEYSLEDRLSAFMKLQKNYNMLGLTSIILGSTEPAEIEAFNRLYREGNLNLRVVYTRCMMSPENVESGIEELSAKIETPAEWGKLGFLKVIIDGGILTGTAYMREPYGAGWNPFGIETGFRGVVNMEKEQIIPFIENAYELGLQMTAHCVGDGAVDRLLSAYEDFDGRKPLKDRRFSFIHADFTDKDVLRRMSSLGLLLISQPAWHYMDGSILNRLLGPGTMKTFLPYKNAVELGVQVCGGSDHMVKHSSFASQNPYNPFLGLYNLVTRRTCRGERVMGEQALSRREALAMYTSQGAYASFDENRRGTLEEGRLADMAVLSDDFFACPESGIPAIVSECTVVGGQIVYQNPWAGSALREGGF